MITEWVHTHEAIAVALMVLLPYLALMWGAYLIDWRGYL